MKSCILGMNNLSSYKLPSGTEKIKLSVILYMMGKDVTDKNWACKMQLDMVIGLDNTKVLPMESWKCIWTPANMSFL